MSKKAPKFQETLESRGRKKKTKSAEYYKQRLVSSYTFRQDDKSKSNNLYLCFYKIVNLNNQCQINLTTT